MSGTAALLMAPSAHGVWRETTRRLRAHYQIGRGAAAALCLLLAIVYVFVRLEGPAARRFAQRYGPWFAHLRQRAAKPADPLRYLLQLLWLSCFIPAAHRPRRAAGKGLSALFGRLSRWKVALRTAALAGLPSLSAQAFWARRLRETVQVVRGFGTIGSMALMGVLAIFTLGLGALVITQPFDNVSQFVFVTLLFSIALVIRHIPGRYALLLLIVLSLTISSRYMWWRYTATLNWTSGRDLTLGMLLLAAETYSWIVLVLGYVQVAWPLNRRPVPLSTVVEAWPTVDVFIPTYNEDLSVVRPTIYAALGLDWPRDKLRIHLLDDGRRPDFRRFAEEVGVHYIQRPDNRHAKAGNLNHAMACTDGDLIAIFDCDHIPTRPFLQLTVGQFQRDHGLALVQTPHHFFSPDPFERNLGHFGTQPNENTLFYGLVQDGNDLWNAAFFCGSCAVLRRSAVEAIGGFATETVTEDAHTALRLHRAGYRSAYLRVPMAAGLATESLSAHVGQRIRWARGMVQIFRMDNPMLGRGLHLFQRLCYVNAMLHFMSGIPRLIYLTAPLAFLLLHSYIVYAPAIAILLNVVPHLLHANLTSSALQGSYRRTLWGEIYETVLAWYIARPTAVALLAPKKGAFNVTAKGGLIPSHYYDWRISHPYVVLAFANLTGLGFGIWRLVSGPPDEALTVLITMVWVLFNLLILGGAIAVAAELRQIRRNPRVPSELPARVQLPQGHMIVATVTDFSEAGVGLALSSPRAIPEGSKVGLCLSRGRREFVFPGHVIRNIGTNIGIRFEPLTLQQHTDLVQCTFARADAWLRWHGRLELDQPVESLRGVVELGLKGYRQLARHLPFPFSVILRGSVMIASWLFSFVPVSTPDGASSQTSGNANELALS